MCTNGVNASQSKANIEQIDEAVALVRRWTHRSFHQAEDSGSLLTAAKLNAAQGLLDDVRELLDEAAELIEKEAADNSAEVELV